MTADVDAAEAAYWAARDRAINSDDIRVARAAADAAVRLGRARVEQVEAERANRRK